MASQTRISIPASDLPAGHAIYIRQAYRTLVQQARCRPARIQDSICQDDIEEME